MTREEQIDWLCRLRADLNNGVIFTPWNKEFTEALTGILEQEPKIGQEKWIEERTYMECPNCHDIWHYEENQTERFKCCPTCGERNEYESKYTRNRI